MYVLGGLDETFDSLFATLTEKIISNKFTIDVAKALLHESRIERRRQMLISPLPTTNLSLKSGNNVAIGNEH